MRLGRVEVSAGCLLLLAWLNYWDTQGVVALGLLACLLHELAHYGALRLAGAGVRRVRLTAVGAEMEVEGNLSYGWDCLAALSGPGCNLLLALLCCRQPWGRLFAGLSLALGCFNLLPVGRLDGGRALYAGLAAAFGPGLPLGGGRGRGGAGSCRGLLFLPGQKRDPAFGGAVDRCRSDPTEKEGK